METKDESKELNLCELLHEGDIVYSLIDGEGKVRLLDKDGFYLNNWCFSSDGTLNGSDSHIAKCLVFPSRTLYGQYPLDAKKCWKIWTQSHQYQKRITQLEKVISDAQIELDTLRQKIR